MSNTLDPTDAQIATLMTLPADVPLAVLNLFHFNDRAKYQPGDEEYGTPAADISGQEAFQRYNKLAGAKLQSLGGRVEFSAAVDQIMIGADLKWDVAAIMLFPTRRVFIEMLSDPAFQAASRHRKAALADHTMIHLQGAGFICGA